jgi:hypothetical protein
MFAFSIGRRRTLRCSMHLRTLMITVAVLPFAWLGGREVWTMWCRWDDCYYAVEYFSMMEGSIRLPEPSDTSESSDMLQAMAESQAEAEWYSRAKLKYQYAMWRPWVYVEPYSIRMP